MTTTAKFYESPRAVVYCGRGEDMLAGLGTESVDLVVTDPPYGKEWQSNRRAEQFDAIVGDEATTSARGDVQAMLRECVRVVGQNRHLYVFGPTDVMDGLKVSAPAALIWDKATPGSGDVTARWSPAHEEITFMVSKHRHAGETGREGIPTRMRKGSVLRFPRPTGRTVRHPSEKPVPLLRELIESSSRQGDVVLDPYAGVGSTGVAAILAGRRCVLAELNPAYAEIAAARVRAAELAYAAAAAL